MPIKREVRSPGARFGRLPHVVVPPTAEQLKAQITNMLRLALRRLAVRMGVPAQDINTKVIRTLGVVQQAIDDEFGA